MLSFSEAIESSPPLRNESVSCGSGIDKRISVSVYAAKDWPQIEPVWAELTQSSPHASFYLGVDWTAAWLQVFGELLQPRIIVFSDGVRPVGACIVTSCFEKRGPFWVKRAYLNTGGEPVAERTLMEFNNVLCFSGWEHEIAQAIASQLRGMDYDEFAIEGISPGPVLTALETNLCPEHSYSTQIRSSFYVDLERLRASNVDYLNSLSANTRAQVRRSVKEYGASGSIKIEIAPDPGKAEEFFEQMCRMHQSRWASRDETGAFAPGRRQEFHRTLIRRGSATGGVHLVRVTSGSETVGVLYNFAQNGKIYFFQSGFNYKKGTRFRPGLVTHAYAIQLYLDLGFREYDFLVGEARYKQSLTRASRPLAWAVFSRRGVKLKAIEILRKIKRQFHQRRGGHT